MNIAIVTSGFLPVPPSKGGAVENLIYNLMKSNENQTENHLTVYSIYDSNENETLQNTLVKYFRASTFSKLFDYITYYFTKFVLHKKHLITYRYFFQRMSFFKKVGRDLSKADYDAVILENNVLMFRALELYNNFEKYKGKIFYHAHNELGKTLGYDKYLNRATKLICVSEYISTRYRSILQKSNTEIVTVHNIVDEKIFLQEASSSELAAIERKLDINNGCINILFTGRICEEKGIRELIKALAKIESDQYNLLIVGKSFFGTNVKDQFEREIQKISENLRGNIVFTGYIPYEEMYKYYQLADICILPSVWNEPSALTVIECVSSGTPLMTTPLGGIPENIVDSTILLDIEDLVGSIEKNVSYYINNKEALKELKYRAKSERLRYGTIYDYYLEFIRALK